MKRLLLITALLTGLVVLSGCMSARQIQTSTPRLLNTPESPGAGAAGMSLLSVEMVKGATELPLDVQALRFRVEEVRLKDQDGNWLIFPSELNSFEMLPGRPLQKPILSTRVAPVTYDSLVVQIRDVFVLFGDNAGGSLTLSRDGVFGQSLDLQADLETPVRLQLQFEPGASLARDSECRWHFVPFWTLKQD